jgi:transketolase
VAWQVAIERRDGPTALIFTRQNLPTLDRSIYVTAEETRKGAYVLADLGGEAPDIILMASGSEVQWIVAAGQQLAKDGKAVRLVSFPSWELFEAQPQTYRESVLPAKVKTRLAVEAGVSLGWARYVGDAGDTITIDQFGASAPGEKAMEEFGFTTENVLTKARQLLERHS